MKHWLHHNDSTSGSNNYTHANTFFIKYCLHHNNSTSSYNSYTHVNTFIIKHCLHRKNSTSGSNSYTCKRFLHRNNVTSGSKSYTYINTFSIKQCLHQHQIILQHCCSQSSLMDIFIHQKLRRIFTSHEPGLKSANKQHHLNGTHYQSLSMF